MNLAKPARNQHHLYHLRANSMTGKGEPELFIQLEMNSDMIIFSVSQRHISQCAPDAELPGQCQCTVDNERLPARTLHCGITDGSAKI